MRASFCAFIALIGIVGCKPSAPPPPSIPEPYSSGEELVRAMQNRYYGRWTTALTMVVAANDSISYRVFAAPAIERVDVDPITAGNGFLQRGDSLYAMRGSQIARTEVRPDVRMLLEFSVYHLNEDATIAALRRAGFDLSKIRRDTWEGREVYVAGSGKEFWIDRGELLLVRLLDGAGNDWRYGNYKQVGRMWVAPTVRLFRNGQLVLKEDRQHMRIDARIDTAMFRPSTWSTALHWYNQR